MKTNITYLHYIRWEISIKSWKDIIPVLKKFPYNKCRCQIKKGLICSGHLTMTFLGQKRFGVFMLWMRIARRSASRLVATWKGGSDPEQGIEALRAWGVLQRQIGKPKIRSVELFVCIPRIYLFDLSNLLKSFLTISNCPNHLEIGAVENDENRKWTDKSKQSYLQGWFTKTTLPTFGGRVKYGLHIYAIGRTPFYHGKMELILETVRDEYLPQRFLDEVKKAMGLFLLAMCQAGDVESQPIRQGGKRKQEGIEYIPDGRGKESSVNRMVVLSDQFSTSYWESHLWQELRWIQVKCLLLTFAKPLHRNRIGKYLSINTTNPTPVTAPKVV